MYIISEKQIKEIAYKAWKHMSPYEGEYVREGFERWWERNRELYVSQFKQIEDSQLTCLFTDSIY